MKDRHLPWELQPGATEGAVSSAGGVGAGAGSWDRPRQAAEVVDKMGEFFGYRNTGLAYLPVRS